MNTSLQTTMNVALIVTFIFVGILDAWPKFLVFSSVVKAVSLFFIAFLQLSVSSTFTVAHILFVLAAIVAYGTLQIQYLPQIYNGAMGDRWDGLHTAITVMAIAYGLMLRVQLMKISPKLSFLLDVGFGATALVLAVLVSLQIVTAKYLLTNG